MSDLRILCVNNMLWLKFSLQVSSCTTHINFTAAYAAVKPEDFRRMTSKAVQHTMQQSMSLTFDKMLKKCAVRMAVFNVT